MSLLLRMTAAAALANAAITKSHFTATFLFDICVIRAIRRCLIIYSSKSGVLCSCALWPARARRSHLGNWDCAVAALGSTHLVFTAFVCANKRLVFEFALVTLGMSSMACAAATTATRKGIHRIQFALSGFHIIHRCLGCGDIGWNLNTCCGIIWRLWCFLNL